VPCAQRADLLSGQVTRTKKPTRLPAVAFCEGWSVCVCVGLWLNLIFVLSVKNKKTYLATDTHRLTQTTTDLFPGRPVRGKTVSPPGTVLFRQILHVNLLSYQRARVTSDVC
jgi:hypothetical protein